MMNISPKTYISRRVHWENLIYARWNSIKNWAKTWGHWSIDGIEIKNQNKIKPVENINKDTQNFLGMSLMQKHESLWFEVIWFTQFWWHHQLTESNKEWKIRKVHCNLIRHWSSKWFLWPSLRTFIHFIWSILVQLMTGSFDMTHFKRVFTD